MEHVLVLVQQEAVRLDPDRLEALYFQLGEAGAEDVLCRAMEEIALRLGHTERLFRQGRRAEMRKSSRSLVAMAEQIGMNALARVAQDVTQCIDDDDFVALAATLARLLRVGEQSLTAVWDLQGVHL
ncbi:hypothetical protein [Pseudooceanicola algae]|uniref:hypothetical protein n=1 Tax=Pseudooceanicola algae TaxID=1537215 RepID=UPI000E6CE106|nr:hypothetical protein [Pseudooceanicola algae]